MICWWHFFGWALFARSKQRHDSFKRGCPDSTVAEKKRCAVSKHSCLGCVMSTNSGFEAFEQHLWAWVLVCPFGVGRKVTETMVMAQRLPAWADSMIMIARSA